MLGVRIGERRPDFREHIANLGGLHDPYAPADYQTIYYRRDWDMDAELYGPERLEGRDALEAHLATSDARYAYLLTADGWLSPDIRHPRPKRIKWQRLSEEMCADAADLPRLRRATTT